MVKKNHNRAEYLLKRLQNWARYFPRNVLYGRDHCSPVLCLRYYDYVMIVACRYGGEACCL